MNWVKSRPRCCQADFASSLLEKREKGEGDQRRFSTRSQEELNVLELVDELLEREGPVVILDRRSGKLEVVEIGDAFRLVSLDKRTKRRENVRNETRRERSKSFSPCS